MEKVSISKVLKNKEPSKSIGMIDVANKHLYVPYVSKKGTPVIDIVECDYIDKTENGYKCTVIVVSEDGSHFVNTYFAYVLTERSSK